MSFGNPFSTHDGPMGLGHNGFEVSLNYFEGLPDPNIVGDSTLKMIFKSLMKRDDTTKEKALTDLCNYITADNIAVLKDDLVLITWVQLYPKLSISDSKSVRALGHQTQIQFIATLQKNYMKYLKDSIPVLLLGIYDFESSVTNSTLKNLSKVFPDVTKVNNLWIMFQSEILNLADRVLNKETVESLSDDRFVPRDEADLKYLRLVNATISMISHLIQLGLKISPQKLEQNLEEYQDVFLYENLWHYLLVNKNINSQRIFKSLLSLINAVVKLKPDLFVEKAWKLMSKRLIKSLSFSKKVEVGTANASLYSSVIIPIISTLNNLIKVNPAFLQHDKNHMDRITEFLKLGSLNSNPSYYQDLSSFIPLVYSNDQFELVESILHNDFTTELKTNSKLRNGASFIINSFNCYLHIATEFGHPRVMSSVIDEVVDVNNSPALCKQLVEPMVKFIPDTLLLEKLKHWCVVDSGNISILLQVSLQSQVSLDTVLQTTLDDLRDKAQVDEEGLSFGNHQCFIIFDFILINNLTQYKSQFDEFFDELPSYITTSLIELPITILSHYSKSQLYDEELFIDIFDSFIMKLDMLNMKDSLFSRMDSFSHKDVLLSHSTELRLAIKEASSGYDFSDDSLFKAHLLTNDSVLELWAMAKEQSKQTLFVNYLFQNGNENLLEGLIIKTDFLEKTFWTEFNEQLHTTVKTLFTNPQIMRQYFTSLREFISNGGSSPVITNYISTLLNNTPVLKSELSSTDLTSEFINAYGTTIDSRLSIGNPLQSSIYLLSTVPDCFQFEKLAGLIRYSSFLSSVGCIYDLIFLCLMSEVASDYVFLNDGTSLTIDGYPLHAIKAELLKRFSDENYESIVTQLISKDYGDALKSLISENEILSFYYTRLIRFVLSSFTPSTKVLELDIDGYVRSTIRSKSVVDQLIFQTVLSTMTQFLNDAKFERSRNLIASEMLGLRPTEIVSVGASKLLSLNNFLAVEDVSDKFQPIDPRRLNMIVNEFVKWLDSDVSYEPEFGKIRLLLIQLLQTLCSLPFSNSEAFDELATRVLQDSTGLISLGEEGVELKYYTLKLFISLQKQQVLDSDALKDVENELIDSFVNDNTSVFNQPVVIYMELLHRVLGKLPIQRFEEHSEALFDKYQRISNCEMKRPLLSILSRLLLAKQQDMVIEFELSKEEDTSSYKISQMLIDNIKSAPKYLGEEDDQKLVEYLWQWTLVLSYFKDVTFKLRSLYIQQLQTENDELISRFLKFLSLVIAHGDDERVSQFEDSSSFTEYDYCNDIGDASEEVRLLSVHIYFNILVSIGSLASSWFTDIKDRGFKQKLEQFTSKYVSPSLIEKKLQSFETKIDKFVEDNENLSIKVNRGANEIKCTYLIDEQYMEIVFRVPMNYPLSNVEVLGPKRVGVKEQQWKAWLLACQRIITLQNGELSEALDFFLKNVSFHFKGFEECAICYSILHQDNSLPSKSCQTCKNKFHSGCLYKWFKSSGGNTCPLCRSTFNFR